MKYPDVATACSQAATKLCEMPRELAAAIHAHGTGVNPHDPTAVADSAEWATLRKRASDIEDVPGLEQAMSAIDQAIEAARALFPKVGDVVAPKVADAVQA